MLGLLFLLLSLLGLYWVIRLAVRHGIEDAWDRRADRSLAETADDVESAPSGLVWAWYRMLGRLGWFG